MVTNQKTLLLRVILPQQMSIKDIGSPRHVCSYLPQRSIIPPNKGPLSVG